MLSIRIVTRGAIVPALLLVSGMTAGAAMAQTADGGTAGHPLQLLQNVKQTHNAKSSAKSKPQTKAAARSVSKSKTASKSAPKTASKTVSKTVSKSMSKTASRSRAHTRLTERKQPPAPSVVAQAPMSGTTSAMNSPTGPSAPLAEAGTGTLAASPAAQPGSASGALVPNELVVGGQEVKVASPDKVNEIDLAAANDGGAKRKLWGSKHG